MYVVGDWIEGNIDNLSLWWLCSFNLYLTIGMLEDDNITILYTYQERVVSSP